jgi:hypothetical protein
MDRNANDLKPLSLYAQVLAEVADTLLDSPDITQALAQAQTDASVLRDTVINNSDDIMSSGESPLLGFVERPEWELLLSRRYLRYGGLALCLLLIASIAGTVSAPSLPDVILGCFLLFITLAIVITGGIILAGSRVIEPVSTTRDALRREVVGPYLREQINHILAEQEHSDVMRITAAPGLADLSGREQLVITDTIKESLQLCTSMSSGSIGISGPRGVGKTTLLRYFCDPLLGAPVSESGEFRGFSDLRIFISAPVEFNTKDFVLHLFGKLCQTVIEAERNLNQDASYIWEGKRRGRFASLIVSSILVICGLGLIGYAFFAPKYTLKLTKTEILLGAGALSLATGIGIFVRQAKSGRLAHGSSAETVPLVDEAKAWLTRIGYLQTLTSGYAGSMKIPAGLGLEVTSGRQLSELELTLPDLIDRYKSFAERAIRSRRSVGNPLRVSRESQEQFAHIMERRAALLQKTSESLRKVALLRRLAGWITKQEEFVSRRATTVRELLAAVPRQYVLDYGPKIMIGIDEVDKIDRDSAQRFLNDIKAIFGVPNCLYLVSVSDEALAVFEQRVFLGRTAFDSSFDEVVRAHELDFESCRYLLRRRIAGMPDSLIAFCEVMSGGLPRDLIRTARSVVEVSASGQERIEDLTLSVVNRQVEVLRRTSISEMTGGAHDHSRNHFPESLLQNDWLSSPAQSILTVLEGTDGTSFSTPVSVALYFYATVAEIFSNKIIPRRRRLRTSVIWHRQPNSQIFLSGYRLENTDWIDRLAQVRNMISANGDIAWELINHFRAAYRMRVISRPEPQS